MKDWMKSGLIIVIIFIFLFILTIIFPPKYTLQYLEDGELKTEIYHSTREWNERANELSNRQIKYWR